MQFENIRLNPSLFEKEDLLFFYNSFLSIDFATAMHVIQMPKTARVPILFLYFSFYFAVAIASSSC